MNPVTIDFSSLRTISNEAYYPYFWNQHRYLVLCGGAGSGKSMFAGDKVLFRTISEGPGQKILVVRKIARTHDLSTFPLLRGRLSEWNAMHLGDINYSKRIMTFKPNRNEILLAGLDDPEKIKSIYGITSIWVEEATELTAEDFRQLNLRLRGLTPHYKQIILSFNPIDVMHWLNSQFFKAQRDSTTILVTTYEHNQFIDPEYKNELEQLKHEDYQLWRIYARGLWGVLKGLIYNAPDLSPWPDEILDATPFYGLDYGYNNPSALVQCRMVQQHLYVRQLLYEANLTNQQLIARMKSILKDEPTGPIYADAAEPDRIEEARRAGLLVRAARKGKNSVKDGIDAVKTYRIHSLDTNTDFNNEISTYKWREMKNGQVLDEPAKFNDHGMDAMRMAVFSHPRRQNLKPFDRNALGL